LHPVVGGIDHHGFYRSERFRWRGSQTAGTKAAAFSRRSSMASVYLFVSSLKHHDMTTELSITKSSFIQRLPSSIILRKEMPFRRFLSRKLFNSEIFLEGEKCTVKRLPIQ